MSRRKNQKTPLFRKPGTKVLERENACSQTLVRGVGNKNPHFLFFGDEDPDVRDLSLRVLREMLKNQTPLFENSIAVVVGRLLERHTEVDREVLRSAEETLNVLSNVISPTTCVRILEPIVLADDGAVLLAAIKLLTKVVKKMTRDEMVDILDVCIPGILKASAAIALTLIFAMR